VHGLPQETISPAAPSPLPSGDCQLHNLLRDSVDHAKGVIGTYRPCVGVKHRGATQELPSNDESDANYGPQLPRGLVTPPYARWAWIDHRFLFIYIKCV